MDDKVDKNVLRVNGDATEKNGKHIQEVYRKIITAETDAKEHSSEKANKENSEKMVKDDVNAINDGADEQMLGGAGGDDNGKLTEKRDEVKFIKGDQQNGDAKIDIGIVNGKTFTGMSKEELMKYANDPFWVRLRWIFFILFWAVWLAMLIGAIFIIVKAPKCSAPEPLPWEKLGPLAAAQKSIQAFTDDDLAAIKHLHATGVIYELPAEFTYELSNAEIENQIKMVVAKFKEAGNVRVILDVVANYVTNSSHIVQAALNDASKRSALMWVNQKNVPNNWLSLENGTAWIEAQPENYLLSIFGKNRYDLLMNDTIVKQELEKSLRHLVELGVMGIRLKHTAFYMFSRNLQDEDYDVTNPNYNLGEYGFQRHEKTTFQAGLPIFLQDLTSIVKNASAEAFLTVADDILRPSAYQLPHNVMSVELPIYGRPMQFIGENKFFELESEINKTKLDLGEHVWLQWNFGDVLQRADSQSNAAALVSFVSMLPGVPVFPLNNEALKTVSEYTFKQMAQLRQSPSYMHGDFKMYHSDDIFAYSRFKSGNPGYFVAHNPTDMLKSGNFTGSEDMPEKMTVVAISDNYNVTGVAIKTKLEVKQIDVSPRSTIILTYVPVKTG